MSEIKVGPIASISGKVITHKSFHYKLDEIPNEFTLVFDAIDEDIEKLFISLIDNPTDENKKNMKEISKCFAQQFEANCRYKLNTITYSKLLAGEGMPWFSEDKRIFNPCVVVISFGSDIFFSLQDKKTNKIYNIPLPARSMFLFQDPEGKYNRGISKREWDQLSGTGPGLGSRRYNRKDRYSVIFQSKKE